MKFKFLHKLLFPIPFMFFGCMFFILHSQTQAQYVNVGYTPQQVKAAYNLPDNGGSGIVAVIDAGSGEQSKADLNEFDSKYNLPDCNVNNGCLTVQYVDGGGPNSTGGEVAETSMDIEAVHMVAPQAKILLVLSPDMNTLDSAISYANSQPGVVAMSMSFATSFGSNRVPTEQGVNPSDCDLFSNPNIAYFASSGDGGTGVGYPADCPQVISVGGTTLNLNGSSVASETAWSGSGGGLSQLFQEPSYQSNFNISGGARAVPDVSAVADPYTGLLIVAGGQIFPEGGTSLSAPLWAGISALNNTPVTHDTLYANAKSSYASYFRDITQGSNGSCPSLCTAKPGYDYVTGLGSPILLPGQKAGAPTATPNPGSTITPTPGKIAITPEPGSGNSISLKVTVFVDKNNNGIYDPSVDSPLIGANLSLSPGSYPSGNTNSNGSYTFKNLAKEPANYYKLSVKTSAVNLGNFTITTPINRFGEYDLLLPVSMSSLTPTPTDLPTPTLGSPNNGDGSGGSSGGSGGGSGGGVDNTPTPTPIPYTCTYDPTKCSVSSGINQCALTCTPK